MPFFLHLLVFFYSANITNFRPNKVCLQTNTRLDMAGVDDSMSVIDIYSSAALDQSIDNSSLTD